jgi:hypothetical protein
LYADLARDPASVQFEHGRAEDVGAVWVAACFGECSTAVAEDLHLDSVGHVTLAHVFDPATDLLVTAQDARRARLVDAIDEGDLGVVGVQSELGG